MYFSNCLALECLCSRSFCLAVFCGFLLAVVLFSPRYCCRNSSSQRFVTSERHFSILNSLFFFLFFFAVQELSLQQEKQVCLTQIVFFSLFKKTSFITFVHFYSVSNSSVPFKKYDLGLELTMKSLQMQGEEANTVVEKKTKKKKQFIQPIVCSLVVQKAAK